MRVGWGDWSRVGMMGSKDPNRLVSRLQDATADIPA